MNLRAATRLAGVLVAVSVSGCRPRESGGPAPTVTSSPSGGVAPIATPSASSSAAPIASTSASASPGVGGPWVRCYAHFRPTSTPVRDVTRLGMLCGPQNGMKQLGATIEGETVEERPAKTHAITLERGQCVRLFAVADEGVKDLAVRLLGPKGERLGGDHVNDRWPIVDADRAVCVFEAGTYTAEVEARRGKGKYALQVWLLP